MKIARSGKVRDIYEVDVLALTTTDRVSAYDSVLAGEVPYKGLVLQTISNKWMEKFTDIISNHIITVDPYILKTFGFGSEFFGRTILAKKCIMLPIECIVRGYYIPTSHSWDQYKVDGTIQGIKLPLGLVESEKLPEAIFTPTTKGESDLAITYEEMKLQLSNFLYGTLGDLLASSSCPDIDTSKIFDPNYCYKLASQVAEKLRDTSLQLYNKAASYAAQKGIILADTKLEFGIRLKDTGNVATDFELVLCDEAFTPDSSRYWDAEEYEVGKTQKSMDKQFLRDYLRNELNWTGLKDGPVPEVPAEVYDKVSQIYCDIMHRLFDINIDDVVSVLSHYAKELEG